MRCDQCIYWSKLDPREFRAQRMCNAIRARHHIEDDAREKALQDRLDRNAMWNSERSAVDSVMAYAEDGSDYVAHIYTRADFFCALFEQKD